MNDDSIEYVNFILDNADRYEHLVQKTESYQLIYGPKIFIVKNDKGLTPLRFRPDVQHINLM